VQAPSVAPHVLVVLVAHDGAAWLPRTLAALDVQTHPHVDVVAVDNGSTDGSRGLLLDHLGPDRVLVAELDLGFGAAVSMALDARPAAEAPYVLLLHDDLVLDPEALAHLVAALDADPRLAVVGPKLLSWDDERALQSVGWTVDITGRADNGVDEGELDQGQRDQERRTLYVSTGGMLIRRHVLDELGRFDRRYHLFRDDLDLCWRAWLAGHDVEVIPDARGIHVGAAANYLRLGQTRFIGPRYFAERNTLATLLKNYGPARLLPTVTLYFLVGIAKILGFLLTRRVSDAWQTVRAWLWNGYHLRETWRLRREVQRSRVRSDAELRELFGKLAPRMRAYVEAIADWVAGGDVGGTTDAERAVARAGAEPEPALRRILRSSGAGRCSSRVWPSRWCSWGGRPAAGARASSGEGSSPPGPPRPPTFLVDYGTGWHEAGAFGTATSPSRRRRSWVLLHLLVAGSVLPGAATAAARAAAGRVVAGPASRPDLLGAPAAEGRGSHGLRALATDAGGPGDRTARRAGGRGGAARAWSPPVRRPGAARPAPRSAPGGPSRRHPARRRGGAFEPLVLPAALLAGAGLLGVAAARVRDAGWRRALSSRIAIAVRPRWCCCCRGASTC
jgi:GT2 family glycosyltransferase